MATTPLAIRKLRQALKPPSSGRKLAAETRGPSGRGKGVSQSTLCQIANGVIVKPRAATKKRINAVLDLTDGDWE